ncbi:transposase, partial [Xenorhabdus budapestensis]
AVLERSNTSRDIYADKGYASQMRERALKEQGYQKGRNKKIAKTRARVEHIFGSFSQMGEKFIRTTGQRRANFAMTLKATCYDLHRLVYFGKSGIHAF